MLKITAFLTSLLLALPLLVHAETGAEWDQDDALTQDLYQSFQATNLCLAAASIKASYNNGDKLGLIAISAAEVLAILIKPVVQDFRELRPMILEVQDNACRGMMNLNQSPQYQRFSTSVSNNEKAGGPCVKEAQEGRASLTTYLKFRAGLAAKKGCL